MPVTSLPHKSQSPTPTFLMLGDSLVAGFDWQKRIHKFTVRNCGVPGATTHELLSTMPRLKSYYSSVRLIMLMIGTNDLVQGNANIIEDLKKVILFLSRNYPDAELLVNSLLPMRLPHLGKNDVIRVNGHIEALCRQTGSCYVDVYARFLQADVPLFQADGVHITEAGYEIWARTLLEHIAFMLESD